MGASRSLILAIVFSLVPLGAAMAHDAASGDSGLLHVLSDGGHVTGFFILGAMSGLYLYFVRGHAFIFLSVLPLMLLASHAHLPITTPAGLVFALGFLAGGFIVAFVAAELSTALIKRLGLPRPRTEKD